MSQRKPSEKLKSRVKDRAKNIFEYCKSQAVFSSQPFAIEHIIPFIEGRKTVLSNLAFACHGCNGHKYTHTTGRDIVTRKEVSLFNPRKQHWNDHFTWNDDFTLIVGKTPIGRATVETLQLNREGCLNLRRALFAFGKHPPIDD